jgi:hypothetical protein
MGRELAAVLLLAAGCSGGASSSMGGQGGAPAGQAGATGSGGATSPGLGGASGGPPDAGSDQRGAGGTGAGGSDGATDGGGAAWLTPPAIHPALVAPAGATVKVHVHAEGVQIYTCTASGDAGADAGSTSYAWVLKAPDARLYDAGGVQVGTHGAGPNWTANDGSVAIGTKVIELPSPLSDAISWLLLRVSSTSGAGIFSDVTYVQRLSTSGGKAPASGCDATTVGTETRAAYAAEYYLYAGGGAADWLVPPANLPDAIAIPGSVRIKLHYRGIGFQIYGCLANGGADAGADAGPTTYGWVFKAPEATLYNATYLPSGLHGAGPSWTSSDGSVLTARLLAQVDAPLPDAIPWLLLKEFSVAGDPGELSDIAIVQRLNTAGGKVPTSGCDVTTADTLTRVPYSADYYFYDDFGSDAGAGN